MAASLTIPGNVRVALCWRKRDPDGNIMHSAEELAVHTAFPTTFRLDIGSLPPEDSLNTRTSPEGVVRFASGALLVYEDDNADDKLEVGEIDVSQPDVVDRVLGTTEGISISYLEGPDSYPRDGTPPRGFSQHRARSVHEPVPGGASCEPVEVPDDTYLPLATPLSISLSGSTKLPRDLCEESTTPPTAADDAERQVTCSEDGHAYVSKSCGTGLCSAPFCAFQCMQSPPEQPLPAEWPCR